MGKNWVGNNSLSEVLGQCYTQIWDLSDSLIPCVGLASKPMQMAVIKTMFHRKVFISCSHPICLYLSVLLSLSKSSMIKGHVICKMYYDASHSILSVH